MKKFELPLWSDTIFIFSAAFLLFFCIFRFYTPALWSAVLFSILSAASLAFLSHSLLKKRRKKSYAAKKDREDKQKLCFHLAVDTPENNLRRIAECLAKQNGEDASVVKGHIESCGQTYYLFFRLEPTSADELIPVIREGCENKTVVSNSFTKDAQAVALSFGIRLLDADELYPMLKETETLPENYIMGNSIRRSLKNGIRLRLSRKSFKGYLLAGVSLLLFSLISIFPVYYIVAGGLMLAAAVLVRIFGKT